MAKRLIYALHASACEESYRALAACAVSSNV